TTVEELRRRIGSVRRDGRKIGLVPTMGALHDGHLSLVRASRAECGFTVVTIYVNPSQFGPNEDYRRYPRTLQADLDLLAGWADLVFAPDNQEVYPPGFSTWVEVGSVAEPFEGEFRPTHFRGVATIVLKLFNMVGADVAYFGQKDYQQAKVIQRMVEDLNVPIELRVCPIVREPDGLAMSSRNAYLNPGERRQAAVLCQGLRIAQNLVAEGRRDAGEILERVRAAIQAAPDARIDYVALADPETLEPVSAVEGRTVLLLAVRIGATRLIDNCILEP
ncbi:MAG: pantoate--beta-alanine ligase, partial [Thermoguttaceae bacterium]|nr:pantoate--beta-alanine ligase [Thermoguttaceae bacterium]